MLLVNINGNNNIMIKTLTQKNSVEICLESINNNAKKNACEERATATNTIEINKDMRNNLP